MAELALHRAYSPARQPSTHPPLLLLNSLATTTEIWDPLLPRLTAMTSVLQVDYPGHGGSPARDLPHDLDDLAAQFLRVIDSFGVSRVHVAGVSIGGMTALRLADLAPDRVASITVIGSAPTMDAELWRRRRDIVRQWGTRGLVPDVLRRWFTPEYAERHPDVVRTYVAMLEGTVDSAYERFSEVLAGSNLRSTLDRIACPSIIVSGSRDLAASVDDGALIAGGIAGARHVVVEGAAHMLQAMAAERVAEAIIENVTLAAER